MDQQKKKNLQSSEPCPCSGDGEMIMMMMMMMILLLSSLMREARRSKDMWRDDNDDSRIQGVRLEMRRYKKPRACCAQYNQIAKEGLCPESKVGTTLCVWE